MSRWRAAAMHLGLSAVAGALVSALVFLVWFPGVLFQACGAKPLLAITMAVSLVSGPALTLAVFKSGKRGMTFDLVAIGVTQVVALGYGVWMISQVRPVYIAFVKDRFELARAIDIPDEALEQIGSSRLRALPWTGPRIVGVRFPMDADEKFRLMVAAAAGADIHCWPRYHVPYDTSREAVKSHARALQDLAQFNPGLAAAQVALERNVDPASTGFLPMRAGKVDLTVLVDRGTGAVLDIAPYKPWGFQ